MSGGALPQCAHSASMARGCRWCSHRGVGYRRRTAEAGADGEERARRMSQLLMRPSD